MPGSPKGTKKPRRSAHEKAALYHAVNEAVHDGRTMQSVFDEFAVQWNTKPANVSQVYRTYARGRGEAPSKPSKQTASDRSYTAADVPLDLMNDAQLVKLNERLKSEVAKRRDALEQEFQERRSALERLANELGEKQ